MPGLRRAAPVVGLIVLCVAAACAQLETATPVPVATLAPTETVAVSTPSVIAYPEPALRADVQPLKDAGCTQQGNQSDWWDCQASPTLAALGCQQVEADPLLAGLTPADPVVHCYYRGEGPAPGDKFTEIGGLARMYHSYLIYRDGEHRLATPAELLPLFAPVESADEALGYAMLDTGLGATYDLRGVMGGDYARFLVKEVELTHVDEIADGFTVRLFTDPEPLFGCGLHTVSSVDVTVTRDGRVGRQNTTPVYEFEACID